MLTASPFQSPRRSGKSEEGQRQALGTSKPLVPLLTDPVGLLEGVGDTSSKRLKNLYQHLLDTHAEAAAELPS